MSKFKNQTLEQEMVARSFMYVAMVGNGLQCYGSHARCLEWAEAWNSSISPNCQKAEVIPLYTHPSAEIERLRAELEQMHKSFRAVEFKMAEAIHDQGLLRQKLADAQALLRGVADHCNSCVMPTEALLSDWGKSIDAFLSATAQPAEVDNNEQQP